MRTSAITNASSAASVPHTRTLAAPVKYSPVTYQKRRPHTV